MLTRRLLCIMCAVVGHWSWAAADFWTCALNNDLSFAHDVQRFSIRTASDFRRKSLVLTVAENRTVIAMEYNNKLFDPDSPHLMWFSSCDANSNSNAALAPMKIGSRFSICQAGYPNRQLVYDEIFRSFFVLSPASHHRVVEAVVFDATDPFKPHFCLELVDHAHRKQMVMVYQEWTPLLDDRQPELIVPTTEEHLDMAKFRIAHPNDRNLRSKKRNKRLNAKKCS